jgi:hypothetical protein
MFRWNRSLISRRRNSSLATKTGRGRTRFALLALEERAVPATLTVMNNNDSGPGSLRDILAEAASPTRPGPDTIVFDPSVIGTITLSSPLLVDSDVSIQGPGANVLAISGNNLVRVFDITDGAASSINVAMSGLTVRNGAATRGAGIAVGQNDLLSLNAMHITANVATNQGGGVDVQNGGGLNVLSSTFSNNSANLGGGISFTGAAIGNVSIRNSTISNNSAGQGGGIALDTFSGEMLVTNSTVLQNKATGGPGGGIVRLSGTGTVTLTSTIVWGNTTSAGTGSDMFTGGTVNYRYSLIGNTAGITTLINNGNNLTTGTNPFLGALGNNGGTMPTHPVLAGSPVIDKGLNPPTSLMAAQNGVTRTFGNADIGAFEYTVAGIPTVAGTFPDVTATGGSVYTFQLTFVDDVAINVNNLATGLDIYVNGPNGFTTWATFESVDINTYGSPRVATYSFTPPGGMWDGIDNGLYTIGIAKNAVYDNAANPVRQGDIGQFIVNTSPTVFVVTNDLDDGPGSLRNAVALANANVGVADTVVFDPVFFSVPRTITLTTGEIGVTDPVTIAGPGANFLAVSGNNASRIFAVSDSKAGAITVNISDMIITGGITAMPGGAMVIADEAVTLTNVTFTNNRSTGTGLNAGGGAIAITGAGMLAAFDCNFTGNKATGAGGDGGAIRAADGSSVTLTRCLVSGNSANGDGGAIYINGATTNASLVVVSSAIVSNSALNLVGNGGGVFFVGSVGSGGLVFRNSTISGNTAVANGGGIATSNLVGSMMLQNNTITDNSAGTTGKGGGVSQLGGSGQMVFQSTVISGNFNGPAPDVFTTGKASFTTSALGSATGINTMIDNGNNLPIGAALNLGVLTMNGGPTPSHLPGAGSLLIDRGSNPAGLSTDQRGVNRVDGVAADIGAVEAPSPGIPVASVSSLPNVLVAGGTVYEFTVTYKDETGISVGTLDNSDIRIVGPNGYNMLANLVGVDNNLDGSPRVATYSMVIPGGTWDGPDAGIYTVSLEPNQVADVTLNFAVGGLLGSFKVDLPNTYVVTNSNDSGPGSLRNAIAAANLTDSPDTITFSPGFFNVPRTIMLTTGQLAITRPVMVQGPGAGLVTVSGGLTSRIFSVDDGSAATSMAVSLSGMTLTNGRSSIEGGAIYLHSENLTLNGLVITGNSSATGSGGGIYVADKSAVLTIADSTLSNNTAGLGMSGGGLRVDGAATVNITRTVISGNVASLSGGGIYFNNGGSLTITDSTVSGNTAKVKDGGGIYFFGPITVGGFTIRNTTVSGNSGGGQGGGLAFASVAGTPIIQNATIVNNTAGSGNGGGIARTAGTNTINLVSTIVAQNTGINSPDMHFNAPTALTGTNNLVGVADVGNFTMSPMNLSGVFFAPLNPMIGSLAVNFGGTPTHALLPGSPAINNGSNPSSLLFDQRGPGFLRVAGGSADIGAFEVQTAPVITGVVINDGSKQRSMVTSISVPFNTLVNFAGGIAAAAFKLERMSGATPVGTVDFVADVQDLVSHTVVKLTFNGSQSEFGSLVDGLYRLTVTASAITDYSMQMLDGDGNGTAGDNFVSAPGSIHRLFGDADGNRLVDASDFNAFRLVYGTTGPSMFDFDNDNQVSAFDFAQFRLRYGRMV